MAKIIGHGDIYVEAKIGDSVTFKDGGTETYGRITHINGSTLTVSVWDSVEGVRYSTFQDCRRCSRD